MESQFDFFQSMKSLFRSHRATKIVFLWQFFRHPKDWIRVVSFLVNRNLKLTALQRLRLVTQLYLISYAVDCVHDQEEILRFIESVLCIPAGIPGKIVEAGSFRGGSTAKFSLVGKIVGRELIVFDSFQGLPETFEAHEKNIFGGVARFQKGDYCGKLEEVRENVARWGCIDICRFVEGWFEDTMRNFKEPIVAAYLDVDLEASTRTCLKYLYPLLAAGGVIFSHDGHLPLVAKIFGDEAFWKKELGYEKPIIEGLWEKRLIKIKKPLRVDGTGS